MRNKFSIIFIFFFISCTLSSKANIKLNHVSSWDLRKSDSNFLLYKDDYYTYLIYNNLDYFLNNEKIIIKTHILENFSNKNGNLLCGNILDKTKEVETKIIKIDHIKNQIKTKFFTKNYDCVTLEFKKEYSKIKVFYNEKMNIFRRNKYRN